MIFYVGFILVGLDWNGTEFFVCVKVGICDLVADTSERFVSRCPISSDQVRSMDVYFVYPFRRCSVADAER